MSDAHRASTAGKTGAVMSMAAKFGYGAGEFSSAIFWVTIAFWLMNYLTDVIGLSAALAGLAVLAGKAIDAFVDPAVGFISDKTRSRWGRRRPWFLFGAIPFGLAFILMFAKPGFSGQGGLFAWSCLAFIILNVAYSCVNVPYNSLFPELSDNYDERSSITGVKSVYSIFGALLGAGAAMPVITAAGGGAGGFLAMGVLFGILAAVGVLVPFFSTREKARGLGLTRCLSIMKQLGGLIEIANTGPEGTTVAISVPAGGCRP
jgi:GPH family glycoside/pentoside/hexuronide:cation symporter